jgi:phi13 family phage major tail protein
VLYPDPELAFKTKLADLPLLIQEMIFSNEMDDNGVLIRKASDKPGYFAVGFKSEKANGKYRYIWLYKTRAKPVTENYATREGKTITRQTGEVEWVAVKRISDGRYQAVADEGENGFTAEKAATFLDSVYTPVVAVPGD